MPVPRPMTRRQFTRNALFLGVGLGAGQQLWRPTSAQAATAPRGVAVVFYREPFPTHVAPCLLIAPGFYLATSLDGRANRPIIKPGDNNGLWWQTVGGGIPGLLEYMQNKGYRAAKSYLLDRPGNLQGLGDEVLRQQANGYVVATNDCVSYTQTIITKYGVPTDTMNSAYTDPIPYQGLGPRGSLHIKNGNPISLEQAITAIGSGTVPVQMSKAIIGPTSC